MLRVTSIIIKQINIVADKHDHLYLLYVITSRPLEGLLYSLSQVVIFFKIQRSAYCSDDKVRTVIVRRKWMKCNSAFLFNNPFLNNFIWNFSLCFQLAARDFHYFRQFEKLGRLRGLSNCACCILLFFNLEMTISLWQQCMMFMKWMHKKSSAFAMKSTTN